MAEIHASTQKLSVFEKIGYSAADAAANFVFMTMVLFQTSPFYKEVFGISAVAAGAILLIARLWDAFADPIVGVLADRTNTRWGKFRPWIIFTTVPWCVVMVLAYTTPRHFSPTALIAYAAVTNILLMTIYSMNNMPYAALGGVMTGDVHERASLNSYRFVSVNIAQFIVGGFTLPIVAKFADNYALQHTGEENVAMVSQQYGWQMTMTIWSVLCFVLFLITFFSTRERIKPPAAQHTSPKQDFADLFRNNPWKVMFLWTLVHFCILTFRGGAEYDYYHNYANKESLYDLCQTLHLTAPKNAPGAPEPGGPLEFIHYIVHGERADVATDPKVAKQAADCGVQHHSNARYADDHHRHRALGVIIQTVWKEVRVCFWICRRNIGHVGVLFASADERFGYVGAYRFDCRCLCADHPFDVGHLCRRGRFF